MGASERKRNQEFVEDFRLFDKPGGKPCPNDMGLGSKRYGAYQREAGVGMKKRMVWVTLIIAAFMVLSGFLAKDKAKGSNMGIHYLEIVCTDVATQCDLLEKLQGLSFGPPVADLGGARVAKAADGSHVAVRAPLAEHEQPITRAYMAVADIQKAVKEVEAAGGIIAYPPTKQGDTGTWAVYILNDLQMGLWQK